MDATTPAGHSQPPDRRPMDGGRGVRPGLRALAETVAVLTDPLFGKRGFATGRIITEWPLIVGERLAARSLPERVKRAARAEDGATLHLRVASGALALELQHLEPLILERINAYFGFRAVTRLRLIHGPLPEPPTPLPPLPPLTPEVEAAIDATLVGIEEVRLKQVLARLGRSLFAGDRGGRW